MARLSREAGQLGEYSDEASNDNDPLGNDIEPEPDPEPEPELFDPEDDDQ